MSIDINHSACSQFEKREKSIQASAGANIELLDSTAATASNAPLPNFDNRQHVSTCSIENKKFRNSLEQTNDSGNVMLSDSSPVGKASGREHNEKSTLGSDKNKIDVEHQQAHYSKLGTQKAVEVEVASSDLYISLNGNSCLKQSTTNEGHAHELDNICTPQESKDVLPEEIPQDMAKVNGSLLEGNEKNLDKKYDKTAICTGDGRSSLPDNSPESVESNTYKQLFIEKKSLPFQSDGSPGSSKRMKKVNDEVVCSGPFPTEGNSFLNWMTNVAQSYPVSAQKPPNTKLINSSFLPSSDAVEHLNCVNAGFQPFVQALYHPGTTLFQQTMGGILVHPPKPGNCKELKVAEIPSAYEYNEQFLNKEGFKQLKSFPLYGKKVDQSHLRELSPTSVPSSGSDKSPTQERSNHISNENHFKSSEYSKQNDSTANTGCTVPVNSDQYLGSFWITRLHQKTAQKINKTSSQNVTVSTEMLVNDVTECLPLSKDVDMSIVVADQIEHINNFPLKDGKNSSTSIHHHIIPSGSCVPKVMYTKSKPKSNCNLICPSQRLRKLEPMASVFAKRLDALKHINVSGIVDDFRLSTFTCFYCGRSGHYLKECTEIADTERDDLLEKIKSFDKPQNTSCFCIQCFRLNHWAVACPYVPNKTAQSPRETVVQMKNETKKPPDTMYFTDDEPNMFSSKVENPGQVRDPFESHCGTTSSFNADHMFVTNSREGKINMILDSKSPEDNLALESEKHMMQIAPYDDNNTEFKIKQALVVQISEMKRKPEEKARIFDRVRGLRLSRKDLSSGIKSPLLTSCLKGFYLRVRLGKWQEGIGGTEYHVACITGATSRNLHERKYQIQVNIGGLELSLDCRFVSNHDFIEDELHAWWTQTLLSGERLPSEEELTRKLQERKDFSFKRV